MAEAVAAGARDAGVDVSLWQVAELVPDEILEKSGAHAARATFAHVPVATPTQLAETDAIIFGTPTRFGNMAAQMRNFLDQTGRVVGKRRTGRQGGERLRQHGIATRRSGDDAGQFPYDPAAPWHDRRRPPLHLPYTEQRLMNMAEISGGTPYGATTLADIDGSRQPSENELAIARFQGRHVA
jgi:NAD(P)H dehydrogenase (quinone)